MRMAFLLFIRKEHALTLLHPEFTKLRFDLSFPQSASPIINTVYIPFILVRQLMMVGDTVDTLTGLFIVDTGSEHLVINKWNYQAQEIGRIVVSAGNKGLV